MRLKMSNESTSITQSPINLDMLLYGDATLHLEANKRIFDSIHQYLKETKRFD